MKLFYILFFLLFLSSCTPSEPQNTETPSVNTIEKNEGKINLNGVGIYYKTIGQGEPMIVVHGGPGLDHSYLLPQMKCLAQDYQLIFFDQRACGKSDGNIDSTDMTISKIVDDIDALRKALGLKKIHLLGHSWGGFLAMHYGIRYSEQLHSLILSNTMAPTSEMFVQADSLLNYMVSPEDSIALEQLIASEGYQNETIQSYEDLFRIYFRTEFYHKHYVDSLTLELPDNFIENSYTLEALYAEINDYNLLEDLKKIQCPTLILFGDMEPIASISGDSIRTKIPNSSLQVIPNCGHFPYIEAQEAFLSAIKTFHKKE